MMHPIYIKTSPVYGKHAEELRHRYPTIGNDIPVVKTKERKITPHSVLLSRIISFQVL